ncbi:caspase 8, partial [Paramuricea clavata]
MEKPYGVAVIINIEHFEEEFKFSKRKGSHRDVANLVRLWGDFDFRVKMDADSTTANEIYIFLRQVASEINTNSSCFVCCIMTHGDMGEIYGSDGKPLDIKFITNLFKEDMCPALVGKPKLFFIQACRRSNKLRDHAKPEVKNEQGSKVAAAGSPKAVDSVAAASDADYERKFLKRANPNEINFLIGYSTVPGYVSYRDVDYGSWYTG